MFSVRSRLVALLQPWLQSEPDLELKLGFLRANGTAKDLLFDVSALNRQIGGSGALCFKEFRVRSISIRGTSWSAPALSIHVDGLDVTMAFRESAGERRSYATDRTDRERKEILAAIDPEGTVLHDVIERISIVTLGKNWLTLSLWNFIFRHSELLISDVHFKVQLPTRDNSLSSMLKIKEFTVKASHISHTCLLKGLFGCIFMPQKSCSLALNASQFEIGLKREEHVNFLLSRCDLFSCLKLKDLQVLDLDVRAPQLDFTISPVDLPVLTAFSMLSSQGVKHIRNGRELWKIAARKLDCMTSNPRLCLHKLVDVVTLWLHYVHAYESLLLLVGYPSETVLEKSSNEMLLNKNFSTDVKHRWKAISEIEKDLPVEALARARRIGRYRAAAYVEHIENNSDKQLGVSRKLLRKLFSIFSSLVRIICIIFQSVIGFLGILDRDSKVDETSGVPSQDFSSQYGFSINKISITVSPINAIPSPSVGDPECPIDTSKLTLLSFCVAVDTFLLIYNTSNIKQSLFLSCGDLKVNSSHATLLLPNGRSLRKETKHSFKQGSDVKAVVWSEPALMSLHRERIVADAVNATENDSFLYMESYLEKLWSNWKKVQNTVQRSNIQDLHNPFLLCEIKNSLIVPCFHKLDCGIWKCILCMGRLNFDLEYSSIISVSLLLRQMQHALHAVTSSGSRVLSQSPSSIGEPIEVKRGDFQNLYGSRIKMAMLGVIPEKKIQIGVAIAGAKIRMSMQELGLLGAKGRDVSQKFSQGSGDNCIVLGLENIELIVWPTSKASLVAFTAEPGVAESKTKNITPKRPRLPSILQVDYNEKYICPGQMTLNSCLWIKGLTIYWDDSVEDRLYQVIRLKTISVRSSVCREYVHSLTTSATALSTSLCVVATGITFFTYTDELLVFFQVVEYISSAVTYFASTSLDTANGLCFILKKEQYSKQDPDGFTQASGKGANLILDDTQFVIDASFELSSLDIIMHKSRESHVMKDCKKFSGVSSNEKLTAIDVPEEGIVVTIHRLSAQIFCEDGHVETLISLSEIKSVVFRCQSQNWEFIDEYELNLLLQSPNCLYEFSLSDFAFSLCTISSKDTSSLGRINDAVDGPTSVSEQSNSMGAHPLNILGQGSDVHSCDSHKNMGHSQSVTSHLPASPSYQFFVNIILGEVFMATHSLKEVLIGSNEQKEISCSLSIGGELDTISCTIQGGIIFLETAALAMFFRCFCAHILCITNIASVLPSREPISSGRQSESLQSSKEMAGPGTEPGKEYVCGSSSSLSVVETQIPSPRSRLPPLKALILKLSQFSLVLVVADESGGVWEVVLEADLHLNIELTNLNRKFLFDLHRLMILSQHLHASSPEGTKDIQILNFSSAVAKESAYRSVFRDPTLEFDRLGSVSPVSCDGCSSSSSPVPQQKYIVENEVHEHSHFSNGSYILKHLAASFLVGKPSARDGVWLDNNWVGHGSVSGFELTISLSEIQMFLSLVAPLSGDLSGRATGESKQQNLSRNEGGDNILEDLVPDGAVVAIQDIHQHMYLAVQGVENKYQVMGAIHYSLVRDRALFRVKYCNTKEWGSPALCFTLISLHAKSSSAEPLRLNYRSGSGVVDISGIDDTGGSLWKTLDYKRENYEADGDLESYNHSSKRTFYLVNKKCNCAVAFIDGVPEFVKKPGNPFKVKVFSDFSLARDVLRLDTHLDGLASEDEDNNLPCVNITIDKVAVTIVHELPDANDKFPLLEACVNDVQFIVQVLSSKARLISTFTSVISYFDAQGNLWKELLHPVEMCVFYHSRFGPQRAELMSKRAPTHLYYRTKQVDVSLTELSLDILLFIIGNLDLAGPYAVKSSLILANCCKVENKTTLSLACHFYDSQDAIIGGKQVSSILLRHGALANRLPENSSFLSVQLAAPGTFITSPINVSLLNARLLAWRTRFISLEDSRTYPGPFVVVDVSKKAEDGLSIVVSPLLRIHNETGFSMALRFRRSQQNEAESASLTLRTGDTYDDSKAAVDALNLSGGPKKTLMSLSLGNFLFSFRPEVTEYPEVLGKSISAEWSEDLKGGKAVRISGIFDKLGYRFRKALGIGSKKCSFSTVHCSVNVEAACTTDLHFLIQTIGRDIPVMQPDNFRDTSETRRAPVALQEQKEIFLFPTVQVSNHLQSEIHVLLSEIYPDLTANDSCNNFGKQAIISCGSSAYLYANPSMIYFTVTLNAFGSRCKPVNSADWIKKMQKKKQDAHYLDIDLDFGGGKFYSSLRLSCGDRGILEATIFTSYVLQNETDLALFCFASNQKPLSRTEAEKSGSSISPELGSYLPPKSTRSWFLKSNKVSLKLLEENASVSLLDLDALSGFTELCLEINEGAGVKHLERLGVSLKPCQGKMAVPSQAILLAPRYVISNETQQIAFVRQCYLENDMDGITPIGSKQKIALRTKTVTNKRREFSFVDSLLRKHRIANDECSTYIQFRLDDIGWNWSGPVCIASLGRFYLKFRRSVDLLGHQLQPVTGQENKITEYAVVHIVEEGSTLVLHFQRPTNIVLPYRIENFLRNVCITYYQKDSLVSEILRPGDSVNYVWDDLSLPHQLVVHITDMHLSREINMDKMRAWKPFFKVRQQRGLALDLPLKVEKDQRRTKDELHDLETLKIGYEVYADGPTRVLRISEFPGRLKIAAGFHPCVKIQLRVSNFAVHLLENRKQDEDPSEQSIYSPVVVARLGNVNLDSVFTDQSKHNQIRIQSFDVDEKWVGAPFAAMLRRNRSEYTDMNESVLQIVFILLSADSGVRQVKYSSIVLQPVDLNLDEETLMRLAPFWRTSLSKSTQSQQYYFEHFEIHPIKIVASFLPGSSDSKYSSAQETLRSFMHSVIKIPAIKSKRVELNGILVTHALVTLRELVLKCAKHYSWYGMRAVYIAKGSPLLPPAFASIFDDSASSSLDVFFDPSSGLVNVPGLTLGMFKFVSKCIDKKGFSGTKRYFGDLGKTIRAAGSNVIFAAITEISDSVLKGAEANGFNGMVTGFHHGILKLAMEPSLLGAAVMEGGPDRKIKLDRSPGADELYIEGYLQAMLDTMYKQEYLRVRVIDDQVILKNLPPNSSLMNEIMDHVKSFLICKALLRGESSTTSHPLRHLRGEGEWKIVPTVLTLWEHLFVSFAIRMLRKQAFKVMANIKWKGLSGTDAATVIIPSPTEGRKFNIKAGVRKFVFSGLVAYVDGRLCRCIPNAIVRRIVSGFLLSLLDDNNNNNNKK